MFTAMAVARLSGTAFGMTGLKKAIDVIARNDI